MAYTQHGSPFLAKSKPPAPSKKKSLGYYNKANPTGTGTDAGGGMTEKGVKKYRKDNPGSKLQTAVTKDPSKISTDEMKRDILVYARRDPHEFMALISDPVLKLHSTVHKFIEEGFIKFRNKNKEVWFNTKTNKTRLCTIPFGEDPIYIISSFFQSDDGIDALKHLEHLLDI